MNESVRERKLLDDLANGKNVAINGKNHRIEDEFSRKLLQHIRTLSEKIIEPPIGQDKALELINFSQKIIESQEVLDLPEHSGEAIDSPHRTLRLKKLSAYNFRGLQNYNSIIFTYDFKSQPYLLTGVNGAGKTSVLNAIVWCLTGHLLWDRTMPSVPQRVDIKITDDSNTAKTVKNNWPIQVSIPALESIGTAKPYCWVELELTDGEEDLPVVVRREYSTNKESVTGMDSLDYLSIELALLMPGRVNHIQLNNDTQIGNLFFQISGLNALNKYGVFTSNNGMGRSLTTQINRLQQESQNLKQQLTDETRIFNENLPLDMKEAYEQVAVTEDNPINRAVSRIDWLKDNEVLRLNQLSDLFNISEELPDQQLINLGKEILVAHENLKTTVPSKWGEVQSLFRAIEDWGEEAESAWSNTQDIVKQNLQLSIDWYLKLKQTENLRLKIVAAQLIKEDDFNLCPLCEQKLDHNHSLRTELAELKQTDGLALKSVGEILNSLNIQLDRSFPDSFKRIKASTIKEVITNSYESNIGRFLKGKLESVRDIGYKSVNDLLVFEEPLLDSQTGFSSLKFALIDDPAVIEQFEAFEKKFDEYNKKILLISWASQHLKQLTDDMEFALGYKSMVKTSMLGKLTMANNIAISAKPVQTCVDQLQKVLDLFQQKKEVDTKLNVATRTKTACVDLARLTTISNELLLEDLKRVETELYETYKKLYGGEDLILKKIIPTSSGRNFSLSFWVGFKDMLVEAGGILNASRIRALLWSYVFSLAKVGTTNSSGDWLDFMVIDEPLTSLDQEHQRNFAQLIFNADDQKQVIVASHDLRWPRELQNISQSHSIAANFINCYGISSQRESVRLSDWTGQLEVKWNRWMDDSTDIELGRDYVAAAREWCEDELKDILIWASSPSLARDTLGPLIKKLEKAYSDDQHYGIIQVVQLTEALKLIEADLQNSHHGCSERKNIFKNQIQQVNKIMSGKVIDNMAIIRSTLQHRLSIISIT
ncbi:AAA family ATPase [Paenibacillus tianjinensis]|uniref:Nuclease SbcCD subunit C n=1 Tax=Paenibacillus tianjinensis TaxID=2810347 RepID=A0ABX7LBJ4_9BACL|nr:AAA family ATPase [Paenibacillus tianjinensis]QSF45291.1 AAA family ATPase [Paenibacillus tianjinensis]